MSDASVSHDRRYKLVAENGYLEIMGTMHGVDAAVMITDILEAWDPRGKNEIRAFKKLVQDKIDSRLLEVGDENKKVEVDPRVLALGYAVLWHWAYIYLRFDFFPDYLHQMFDRARMNIHDNEGNDKLFEQVLNQYMEIKNG